MVGCLPEMTQEDLNFLSKYFVTDEMIEDMIIDNYAVSCSCTCTSTYDPDFKWEMPYRCRWSWITGLNID